MIIGNIIYKHQHNISYKYFDNSYFRKLKELNTIQSDKAYLNYIKIINIMGYNIIFTVKKTTSKLKLDKFKKALFQITIGKVISNFYFYESNKNIKNKKNYSNNFRFWIILERCIDVTWYFYKKLPPHF